MSRHIFISHSTKDKEAADSICKALEAEGIKCWIAPRDIKPGEEWPVAIVKAVTGSVAMVLVFSKNADQSKDVAKETLLAINSKINLFPVKLEEHEPTGRMMYFLAGHKWHNATVEPVEDSLKDFIEEIKILFPDEVGLTDQSKDIEEPEPEKTIEIPQKASLSITQKLNLKIAIPLICFVGLMTAGFVYYLVGINSEQQGIRSIHAGGNQSFVILNDGELYSFGEGLNGQLGSGGEDNQLTPILVEDVGLVTDLAAGNSHTIILTNDGGIYSCGNNRFGQLGLEERYDSLKPTEISVLKYGISLAAGEKHSLVLLDNGDLYSFGYKIGGILGHSGMNLDVASTTSVSLISPPKKVDKLSGKDIQKVVAGFEFTLVLLTNGDVYTFGRNTDGQLGYDYANDQMDPLKIELLSDVADIAAGAYHSLVLLKSGDLYSFGKGGDGQLGHGNRENQVVPKRVEGISEVIAIAAGKNHSLALTSDNHLYSFGSGYYGCLGHGDSEDYLVPTLIKELERVKGIAAGNHHSIIITKEEEIYSFGSNKFGQLGLGDQENRFLPTLIEVDWQLQ